MVVAGEGGVPLWGSDIGLVASHNTARRTHSRGPLATDYKSRTFMKFSLLLAPQNTKFKSSCFRVDEQDCESLTLRQNGSLGKETSTGAYLLFLLPL